MNNILIIEDNGELQRLFKKVLGQAGYRVDSAHYLDEALRYLHAGRYDLVLADIQMGDHTSLELLAEWVDDWYQTGTAVVVMSSDAGFRADCEAMGIDIFLEKPIATAQLADLVRRLLPSEQA